MDEPSLVSGFWKSVRRYPAAPALEIGQTSFSYQALASKVQAVARAVQAHDAAASIIGLFCERNLSAYTGILGILTAGKGYMPLNKHYPVARNASMVSQAACTTLVVGMEILPVLETLLQQLGKPMTLIGVGINDFGALPQQFPGCRFITSENYAAGDVIVQTVSEDATAYLLFTSGSTGTPKGVPVTHGNVTAYLAYFLKAYPIKEEDRISQTFDLTFDLSVHDMFVTWWSGACLCGVSDEARFAPAQSIRDYKLTVWFSVPSVGMLLKKFRLLMPDAFPTLRLSLFCGEALPAHIAHDWQQATPRGEVHNLYGPTEATIAIAAYRWDKEHGLDGNKIREGNVSIGHVFPTQRYLLLDAQDCPVQGIGMGELVLAGSQVTPGYWHATDKTRERYIQLPDMPGMTWYRTGDMVMRDQEGWLYFVSRVDHQVKIHGHRVELEEITHVIQKITQEALVCTVAIPSRQQEMAIVTFIASAAGHSGIQILTQCKMHLPSYMIPKRILFLSAMPLNANGKIDRNALHRHATEVL
jgi:amino acid adenylation domain-containing protein